MTALALMGTRRVVRIVERNARVYRRWWPVFLSTWLEPILYLFSLGIGVGALVGKVEGPGGHLVDYEQFVAPGLLATAAMTGCIFDTTFGFFFKYKYSHAFDGMLATPLEVDDVIRGELTWAVLRGALQSTVFFVVMLVMGLVPSWWAVLAVPVAALIGFGFAGLGMGLTTYMRSFFDFDYVQLGIAPLFLFSATFFPLSQYPDALAFVVKLTPLYQGVVMERALVLGAPSPVLVLNGAYLALMGLAGMRVAGTRLGRMLLP
ncbi:MAG TPA: ABC transporter permease [Acidimicrobiales bacterium]|nr:ABC transporter permease [Acidimicrobiales bacterium]